MKQLLLTLILLIAVLHRGYAQDKLTESKESGLYTRIYRLTDKESFDIALKTQAVIDDGFFHTLVDSFYYDNKTDYKGKLPYGNYLFVTPVKNQLLYRQVAVQNVVLNFINDLKNVQFSITDLQGVQLTDAEVKIGKHKQVKYNQDAHSYLTKSAGKNEVISVSYKGVTNYFNFEKIADYYRDSYTRRSEKPIKNRGKQIPAYKGYMVFNKPKYKPLDTVKFKTYLLANDGQVIKGKTLRVELTENDHYSYRQTLITPGKVLGIINPYRDGGYTFDFVLSDSLDLDLDENYSINLKELRGSNWEQVYTGNFRYEDYELKSVNFSVRTDEQEFNPGNPVTVYLSARDENDLAIPDGKVIVTAYTNIVSNYRTNAAFVPDSLWETEVKMDPIGETKLVLPDHIFPQADLNFTLRFTFLNSNNESQSDSKYLRYIYKSAKIKSSLQNDSVSFAYIRNGKPTAAKAKLITWYRDDLKADSSAISLPLIVKLDPGIIKYTILITDGYTENVHLNSLSPTVNIYAVHTQDSLKITANNPQKIHFWYTLFSGNKIIDKGYTSKLDSIIKHSGEKAAHVRLNYIWAGQEKSQEVTSIYSTNLLNINLTAPDLVYPGQVVDMEVKITDVNQRPVPLTDLTAYAFTSKFKEDSYVNLPDFSKVYQVRKQVSGLKAVKLLADGHLMLNWQKWGKALGLDTLVYYQFTHPAETFVTQESIPDTSSAQIAPFVVKNGELLPVHVVYVDEVPVFFDKTDQLQRYSFRVKASKHQIRLRTTDYMVSLSEVELKNGQKTILSVNADLKNSKATVADAPKELTEYEAYLLSKYLVNVEDNFGGEKTVIQTDEEDYLLNPPLVSANDNIKLIGPIAQNILLYNSGDITHSFAKEQSYVYTFYKSLIRQKSTSSTFGFSTNLLEGIRKQTDNYRELAIRKNEIDSLWDDYLNLRSHTTNLLNHYGRYSTNSGQLLMELDTAFSKKMPYVKNILIYKADQLELGWIYPGNSVSFSALEEGVYQVMYLFKDNRYFIEKAAIKPRGKNYFLWGGKKLLPADSFSTRIDKFIKSTGLSARRDHEDVETRVAEIFNERYFNKALLVDKVNGVVTDENKRPLPGVSIRVKGLVTGTATDINGRFELNTPKRSVIIISYIGFIVKEIAVQSNNLGTISLSSDNNLLNEIVVVGYGSQKRKDITGALQVRLAGVSVTPGASSSIHIRGNNSAPFGQKPLIIVDGLPFDGTVDQFKPEDIETMNVLKDASATAIYGSRAAGGVIIIKTKKGNQVMNTAGELVAQQQTMRTNFSDYAFWQPKLITNEDGIAKWKVKFPDDITNWSTTIIAMNGNKQSGQLKTNIKSFKSLSANFVSPQFALAGDSINVIGKLMNYTPLEEKVLRKFSYNGEELKNNTIQFKNSHIDTIAIVAKGKDSLSFKYTLEQGNGYFDGELRKIPVLATGVIETKGYFDVFSRDTTVTYNFLPSAGKITLRAEASVFPALLDEMDKLRKYEYLCNEQLASKLKALLLEKTVTAYLKTPFKYEKDIKEIIKKLQLTKRMEGTWGWWDKSPEQMWISLHVVEALLKAEKQGYPIQLNKEVLYNYLIAKLANQDEHDRMFAVKLIYLLNAKFFIKDWVGTIEKQLDARTQAYRKEVARSGAQMNGQHYSDHIYVDLKPSLHEELQLIQLKQMAGMEINLKSLLEIHKSTMFGGMYWGDENYRFWDNSIQNTLLAYQILKEEGKHPKELEFTRRYFLEQRKDGQWRNTYESALILETILPDLLIENEKPEPVSLVLNKTETIKDFPFTRVIDSSAPLTVSKKGGLPIYFTAYQQFLNPQPQKVSKDFTVKTSFVQKGETVTKLKAGLKTMLKVEVEVRADADYVMIEIPIPAGCSYENKPQSYWGVETHREYFKHKTSIFCTKLKAGKYNFEIELMPRYSGSYALNPAKAEMMYFPVFYGREGMKRVGIN